MRRFAQHMRAENPAYHLVPKQVFAHKRKRRVPYIFSPSELHQLLNATSRLRPIGSLRPQTYYTLFGLLAATGLRISEAMHLVLNDITPDGLVVRKTKFRKNRLVPLHETVTAAQKCYLDQRQAVAGADTHVFISRHGCALTYGMINGTFHFLVRSINIRLKHGQQQPWIHDLRHSFAVRALESCTGGRDRIARHILALSTYLGHAHVADTYWYLQATPFLMTGITDAFEAFFHGCTQ